MPLREASPFQNNVADVNHSERETVKLVVVPDEAMAMEVGMVVVISSINVENYVIAIGVLEEAVEQKDGNLVVDVDLEINMNEVKPIKPHTKKKNFELVVINVVS